MVKKNLVSYWPLVVIFIIVLGIVLVGKIANRMDDDIIQNGVDGEATLSDESGRMIQIHYIVNDKNYSKGIGKPFSGIEDSEIFKIKYLLSDPSNVVVLFDQPILSDKYEYATTESLSIKKTFSTIDFEYKVNDQLVKRRALFNNHTLSPTDYLVRYRIENIQIGYLIRKE